MFEGWEDFYLLIGSAAGALIGLMFVVVTLTAGRGRSETDLGKRFYTSPIVWHLAVILALSGAAMAPNMTPRLFAVLAGGLAVLGIGMGIRCSVGIARWPGAADPAFDAFWYGVGPTLAYVALAGSAVSIVEGCRWGAMALGADLMVLLLMSIHAEWDLVTFLAPIAGRADPETRRQGDDES